MSYQYDFDRDSIASIINNVFLPPKLPQKGEFDHDIGNYNADLLTLCVLAAKDCQSWGKEAVWEPVVKMLKNFSHLHNPSTLDMDAFMDTVGGMDTGDVVALHIGAQNAGLILQETQHQMIFQSFEVSPRSGNVLQSIGKLRCSYPGPAIAVDLDKVKDYSFLVQLSSFLEQMKTVDTLAPNKHTKGASVVVEVRETAHPMFITELLTGILRGIGEPVTVNRFEKRIADEVLWENSRIPWRRSPLWLVVRVALQSTLMAHDPYDPLTEYKLFMVHLMSNILNIAIAHGNVASDILFVMNAKLSRRVLKLTNKGLYLLRNSNPVLEQARMVGEKCAGVLRLRWVEAQKHHSRTLSWAPWSLKPMNDTSLSMLRSEAYISAARNWGSIDWTGHKPFTPQERYRLLHYPTILPRKTDLSKTSDPFVNFLALSDLETWVRDHLSAWVGRPKQTSRSNIEEKCEELGSLIEIYIEHGKPQCVGNPERISIFFLTVMEMWVQLDKLAGYAFPMLLDYPCYYFNDGFLDPLLLPEPKQRLRLQHVEAYLKARKHNSGSPYSDRIDDVFSSTPTSKSFSVRYFDQNDEYKALQKEILLEAEQRKRQKAAELKAKTKEQEELKELAHKLECKYMADPRTGVMKHQFNCRKCWMMDQASRIRVEVFEWPLPRDDLESKAVIFELRCPRGFSAWRDATYRILQEISDPVRPQNFQSSVRKKKIPDTPFEFLDEFLELKNYYHTRRQSGQTIQWASTTKSFLSSHYRWAKLPTDLKGVCVENNLTFHLFDNAGGRWISKDFAECNVRDECTYTLPEAYKQLQFALRYVPYTPNQVIVRQTNCPPEIQLNEYLAFGLVRCGRRIQWLNMLRELRTRTLTFNTGAVNMLFTLCAWQCGPPGKSDVYGAHREAHTHLLEGQFQLKLLAELHSMLESIRSNWQEAITAKTLITIGAQLLMYCDLSTSYNTLRSDIVSFLKLAKRTCLDWAQELVTTLHEREEADEIHGLQLRVVQIAAIARGTFNVEADYLPLLLSTREDVADFVECATLIHDNLSSSLDPMTLDQPMRILLERDRLLAYKIEKYLRALIVKADVGLDLSRVSTSHDSGSSEWRPLECPNERWVAAWVTTTSGTNQMAHYNMLTGRLLVDGKPLGRMPVEYLSHPVYREILGDKLIDVFPATHPMKFQAKRSISNNEVQFALEGQKLIIRTKYGRDRNQTYQLIPKSELRGDFPAHIVENYFFWLNINTGRIDLRTREKRWTPSMYPYISAPNQGPFEPIRRLRMNPEEHLVDVRSETAKMIHSLLKPLEYEEHIEVVLTSTTNSGNAPKMFVRLPRLKLDFVLNGRSLECRQFPQMVVDHDQNLGTFVGLESKLIVRQGQTRSVLVPYGKVEHIRDQKHNHVSVIITTDHKSFKRVRYHLYTIEDTLGRLVGNGSLASHLYKVYLHAVTSSCLPDPLTGRTGTEEALGLLRSAASWSFQRLEKQGDEAEILRLIGSLSPGRAYYPKHLKYMQQITWIDTISPLAQHESFDFIVKDIFSHAESFGMFSGVHYEKKYYKSSCDMHLAQRAAFRNTTYRRDEFIHASEKIPNQEKIDLQYVSRDSQQTTKEVQVYYVAQLVERWPTGLSICPDLLTEFKQWGHLDNQKLELGYHEKLLDLELADVWLSLQRTLMNCSRDFDVYSIMFTLATLAYGGPGREGIDLQLIETLLAFATVPEIKQLGMPEKSEYRFSVGFELDREMVSERVNHCIVEFSESDEARLPRKLKTAWPETEEQLEQRRLDAYRMNLHQQVEKFVKALLSQWPNRSVKIPSQSQYPLITVSDVEPLIGGLFRTCYDNRKFQRYMLTLQSRLDQINVEQCIRTLSEQYSFSPYEHAPISRSQIPLHEALFNRPAPDLSAYHASPLLDVSITRKHDTPQTQPYDNYIIDDLYRMLRSFSASELKNKFIPVYASQLKRSVDALITNSQPKTTIANLPPNLMEVLLKHKNECERILQTITSKLEAALVPGGHENGCMTYNAGLWPQISRVALLQRLAASVFKTLSIGWKQALIMYGIAITRLQRAQRLFRLAPSYKTGSSDLLRELDNEGHQGWDPLYYPDWLLLEIENNVLVRSVQASVAKTMITPPNRENTIMQLLMGEGKSSIIVPIVAAALADSTRLVRVVVLKPLCGQMFQTLVQRLGGLVNRRIFYMPFSRKINLSRAEVRKIEEIFEKCKKKGGILVVQPEHILSFKLLGLERLYNADIRRANPKQMIQDADDHLSIAKMLIDLQSWLQTHSRDILDESDEILNSKHELIYTIGNSKPIEHHPQRWLVVQEVLTLVGSMMKERSFNTRAFEIEESKYKEYGGFHSFRILDLDEGRAFLEEVAEHIMRSQLPLISFRHWSDGTRTLGTRYISQGKLKENEMRDAALQMGDTDLANTLLLLRGLLAHNILLFVLHEKRWKVDYGLDLRRSMLAVPYRAKDSPSEQSEFSHPDVAISLTCLSYYYGGLTESQLEVTFRVLLKTDNPTLEYEKWLSVMTSTDNKVSSLKRLNAINLEDKKQWTSKIVPVFRFNKAVIDFYLSRVVFPQEAREFEHKLSSSGWDIAERKRHPTTGFSGTNDNRYLLPTSIKQHDTEQQSNTNASVLSYLLQSGNGYKYIRQSNDTRLATVDLLRLLSDVKASGEIRVLLDVGAQVLELNNEEVARTWLKMVSPAHVKAAVYFNEADVLTVLTREGVKEPVMISAFAERLDDCIVYLDEAHTRGTDLKLPHSCKAAVTLGPNLTKDRLVQACMRMRKLGHGHLVVFCGPPEIHRVLSKIAWEYGRRDKIIVHDVIYWSMQQTCYNTRKLVPIWAKQGISYQQRHLAANGIKSSFPLNLLESEAKTLEQHYGFERSQRSVLASAAMESDPMIQEILAHAGTFGVKTSAGAPMLEEQERELSHEIESEREVERPPGAEAMKHNVTAQFREFIDKGKLPPLNSRKQAFIPAFEILNATAAADCFERGAWPHTLLVTTDFANTILTQDNKGTDDYLKVVNWVLSSREEPSVLVIPSPWEVNTVIAKIRESAVVTLHMFSARTAKVNPSFNCLDYYTLPCPRIISHNEVAIDLLSLFSGQLYFHDFASYERICFFLGLYFEEVPKDLGITSVTLDCHVGDADERGKLGMPESPFGRNPLPMLRILTGLRRKGQGYLATHVGGMMHGRQLQKEDIEPSEIEEVVDDVDENNSHDEVADDVDDNNFHD